MMVPDFVNLRGVWGWVDTLKDYWSTVIASMGGTLIFGLLVASRSVSALYYQFTSTLRVDIIGGYFCSIALGRAGRIPPRSAIPHLQSASASGLLLPQRLPPIRRSQERHSWQSSFVFISMTIVT
jgi:hypothetical protein